MRRRWSWLLALTAALAMVMRGMWQRRAGSRPSPANGALDGERPHRRERDVTSMTRAELYEEAKRLKIPGRSQMDKDALIRAIERARR